MDEMLCVWMEKHMGGFESALHLDEQPMELCTPQCEGERERGAWDRLPPLERASLLLS